MHPFKHLLNQATRPWVMLLCVITIVCLFLFIDKPLAEYLNNLDIRNTVYFLNILTELGCVTFYLVAFALAALYLRYIQKNKLGEQRLWFLWLCVFITASCCGVLKILLGRARPELWFEQHLYGFYGLHKQSAYWSFPSGHTTCILSIMLGLGILFPNYFYTLILTGFLIALSRVLLVYHYLSDILVATYLVILEIGVLTWVLKRQNWLGGCYEFHGRRKSEIQRNYK